MEIGSHEADLPGFGGLSLGALAFQRLRAGVIDFKYGGARESIKAPGARVEPRAEDYELFDWPGGGDSAIQHHRPELIE